MPSAIFPTPLPTNFPSHSAPQNTDVLVIGAGPAGSACAQQLAAAGLRVVLVDQHEFPRDKVCGDGLIPDAHAALKRIGAYDEVMTVATPVAHVRCVGSRGGFVDVPGTLAVLPRKLLDDILFRCAVRAGAVPLLPARFEAPLVEDEQVVGAVLKQGESRFEVRAKWTVLATGAVPQALMAAGLCERRTPSGVALRGYVKNAALVGRINKLEIIWHKRLAGGYGWIFPAPGGVFNIGVGLTSSHEVQRDGHGKKNEHNLRHMFDEFCALYAPARELMATGQVVGELKGAPLRCSLVGACWSRPGMLVTGEAAGTTYAFSGEGIGKAMETGILAAQTIVAASKLSLDDTAARAQYELALHALKPRFALYEKANRVNQHPWLADLLIWRAKRSRYVLSRMSAVLEEKGNPGSLFSFRGLTRVFLPFRQA